jgi:hypothetical protein
MNAARQSIAAATYALFALEQPISLFELAAAARESRFPLATTQTPGWFAAAADDDYSLLDTAPELLVLTSDLESADEVDVTGIDLIHVYAPELADVDDLPMPVAVKADVEPDPEPAAADPEMPRTSTQLGLLRELSNLDG